MSIHDFVDPQREQRAAVRAPELGLIDFLAHQLYRIDCKKKGVIGPGWMCLRVGIRNRYIGKARAVYSDWRETELGAKLKRDEFRQGFFL